MKRKNLISIVSIVVISTLFFIFTGCSAGNLQSNNNYSYEKFTEQFVTAMLEKDRAKGVKLKNEYSDYFKQLVREYNSKMTSEDSTQEESLKAASVYIWAVSLGN